MAVSLRWDSQGRSLRLVDVSKAVRSLPNHHGVLCTAQKPSNLKSFLVRSTKLLYLDLKQASLCFAFYHDNARVMEAMLRRCICCREYRRRHAVVDS